MTLSGKELKKKYSSLIHQMSEVDNYTPKQIAEYISAQEQQPVPSSLIVQELMSASAKGSTASDHAKKYEHWNAEKDELLLRLKQNPNNSYRQIAEYFMKKYGGYYCANSVRHRYRRINPAAKHAIKQKIKPLKTKALPNNVPRVKKTEQPLEDVDIRHKKDGTDHLESTLYVLDEERWKDDAYVLQAFGYDPKKWRIIRNRSNFWQSPSQEEGKKTLWQVKIDIEPIGAKVIDAEDLIDIFNDHPVTPVTITPRETGVKGQRNLVLAFADLHFGITTYAEMQPYLDELVDLLHTKTYKKIVIEQLGDLFHSDSFTTIRTNSDTLLSTDGNKVDIVQAVNDALSFYSAVIDEALANTKQVEIYHTQGNHSADLEYMFLMILEERYPSVKIHKNIAYRTAYALDHVGIMIAHGDTARKRLPMLFASEYSQIWANSTYRTIHSGHYHKQVVNDENGVVWYQVGTPKPSDGYELKNGFTMAHKRLQVFEYSENSLKAAYYLGENTLAQSATQFISN